MTTRKPKAGPSMALDIETLNGTEIPATRPFVADSSVMRLEWERSQRNTEIELSLIDEQLSSAERIRDMKLAEAERIRDMEIDAAHARMDGAAADANQVYNAVVKGLTDRRDDLVMASTGLQKAIDATVRGAGE